MGTGLRQLAAALLAAVLLALAPPSAAHPTGTGPGVATAAAESHFAGQVRCHAYPAPGETYADLSRQADRWTCDDRDWRMGPERAMLRFDLAAAPAATARFLVARLTPFESVQIGVERADGRIDSHRLTPADFRPTPSDWLMSAPLPAAEPGDRAVVVEYIRPHFKGLLAETRLEANDPARAPPAGNDLLVAALCGLLCVPLLFNLAFYRVLRQDFLLWHTLQVGLMLVQTLMVSGLIHRLVPLGVTWTALLGNWTFGAAVAAAAVFSASFIEPDKLDRRHRVALWLTVPVIAVASLVFTLPGDLLRTAAPTIYYLAWVPVIGCFVWVLATALGRGSRSARFQFVAWAPFLLIGVVRIAANISGGDDGIDAHTAQHLAIALEVLITALGVIDRFTILREQRDSARVRAVALQDIAERDALTTLMNRRGIETRFAELRAQGFTTMAVIDLDRFKTINDDFGHTVGDAVLRAVGEALEPDKDTLAVRLGGEEFVLLLRGADAALRAERRRTAIPVRVTEMVPGLDRLVTASMGLVEHPAQGPLQIDFATLYAQCDRLLYEAKSAGRNRTAAERVQPFFAERPLTSPALAAVA